MQLLSSYMHGNRAKLDIGVELDSKTSQDSGICGITYIHFFPKYLTTPLTYRKVE